MRQVIFFVLLTSAGFAPAYAAPLAEAANEAAAPQAQSNSANPTPILNTNAEIADTAPTNTDASTDADLWQRVRVGFQLEPLDSPLVLDHEQWYSNRPEYIKRFVERGAKYLHHIVDEVEKRNMPMEIALLPVIESAFNPQANSRSHAAGMWQFIPSTGKHFGLKQDWHADSRRDVLASTVAALNYLQKLYAMFNSWELALAAYNCGEGCVARAIAHNQRKGLPTDFLSLSLPLETRNYVPKLIAVKNIILAPGSYGIELDQLPDQPYFTTVKAPAKIDVKLAAKLADMPQDEFLALNPSFNRPVAAPQSGEFLLPLEKVEVFRANLENYDQPLVSWTTYQARRGESLEQIGKRYGVSGSYLRAVNISLKERKKKIAQPTTIMVPIKGAAQGSFVKVAAPVAQQSIAATAPISSHYTIRRGDTLYSVARQFGIALGDLLLWNKLSPKSIIQPGRRLRVSA